MLVRQPRRALGALYWYVSGRKVRARNRLRLSVVQGSDAYAIWVDTVERRQDALVAAVSEESGGRLLFSILVHQADMRDIATLLSSLERQVHTNWELVVVPASALTSAATDGACDNGRVRMATTATGNAADALAIGAAEARGDFLLPLPAGTILPRTALHRYAQVLAANPEADLAYGDHDRIDGEGKRSFPWFKPRWNAEMFLAQDYLSQACVIRTEAARRALPVAPDLAGAAVYALLLEVSAQSGALHVPHVQAHAAMAEPEDGTARLLAVQRFLAGRHDDAQAHFGPFGTVRVCWPLPSPPPLVSVIVPTRDQFKLLHACIEGVLHRTDYGPVEIIIVDNGSTDPATLAYLHQLDGQNGLRVLRDERPYNYAQLNNFAATHARGEYLCLLNNDTEVTDPDWLAQLMRHAVRPNVGAAGAMLLYDDGAIQHAGVVVGLKRAAGHAHRFLPSGKQGYFRYPHVPHYVSAVTAACLVVARAKFDAVGGLDEQDLAIAFNDVDLCLKLQQAGWRNVYVPQAVMIHHESKSRGRDVAPRHVERYRRELAVLQERWGTRDYVDPLRHPQLDPDNEDFTIRS